MVTKLTKVRLQTTNHPVGDLGLWNDSVLKLYIKGDKDIVALIEKAIRKALNEVE